MVFTNTNYLNDAQVIWWTGLEMVMNGSVTYVTLKISSWILYLMVQFAGVTMIACAIYFALTEPMTWQNFKFFDGFTPRNSTLLMNLRFDWFIRPILWIAWWFLKREIVFSHERVRAASSQGEMMLDVENIFQALDEYWTGGSTNIGAAAGLEDPGAEANARPQRAAGPFGAGDELDEEPFGPNDDIGEIAYPQQDRRMGELLTGQCMKVNMMKRWNDNKPEMSDEQFATNTLHEQRTRHAGASQDAKTAIPGQRDGRGQ